MGLYQMTNCTNSAPQCFSRLNKIFSCGVELKASLSQINEQLSALPDDLKEQGLHKLAPYPVGDESNLVVSFWKKHTGRTEFAKADIPLNSKAHDGIIKKVRQFQNAPDVSSQQVSVSNEPEEVLLERTVPRKKGAWWLVPKELKSDGKVD